MHVLVNGLAEAGLAVIIVSYETDEIVRVCVRVLVFREGKIVEGLDSEERILLSATGAKAD